MKEKLLPQDVSKKYKKGQILFEPGDKFDGIYQIKSGYVRAYDIDSQGKEVGIQLFEPMFYLSVASYFSGEKNQHYLETMTPVEVNLIKNEEVKKLLVKNPKIKEELLTLISAKLLNLTNYLSQAVSGEAYSKVAGLVYNLAQEFGINRDKKINGKFKITHKLMASLTGLTRETVTLQMLKLEKRGVIDNARRQIVIKDLKKLKGILGK